MTCFQFDECFNDKRVVAQCNAEGHCTALRFPSHMAGRGCKDPEVLSKLMVGDSPIVTFDHGIIEEHGEHIPLDNPGLIIIRTRFAGRTMKSSIAKQILAKLKARYPDWSDETIRRLKVDITETIVAVATLADSRNAIAIDFDRSDFATHLKALIKQKRGEADNISASPLGAGQTSDVK